MKTAIIIGGTGLVGKELLKLLLNNNDYTAIQLFARRKCGIEHPKLVEHIIDFSSPESWQKSVNGDVLFSTLGTTIKAAKTKARQYEVDFTYQYNFAKAAVTNGVENYVLVSSIGANSKSSFFYLRIKGELEDAVMQLPFKKKIILRPAQLVGAREEERLGEKWGLKVTRLLVKAGIMTNRRPIDGKTVALAMISSLRSDEPTAIYTANELFDLADKK